MGDADGDPSGFRWYVAVCEDYEAAAKDPEMFGTVEDVAKEHGISYDDACGYALFAFEMQEWFDVEMQLEQSKTHLDVWKNLARTYAKQLMEQYRIIKAAGEELKQQLSPKKD